MLEAARALLAAGVPADEAGRDASRLARTLLGWDEAAWLTRRHQDEPPAFRAPFAALVARRRRREPLAYLLGEREFYGRPFRVTPDVLIPRPETELVVDETLAILRAGPFTSVRGPGLQARRQADLKVRPTASDLPPPLIVDVGTGSGCLAITIAIACPDARVVGIDSSAAALEVARDNARRLGAGDRIEFRAGDLLQPVSEPVDLVVSNPPYVPERDRATLAPEVADYEPAGALFAGTDGLDVIRRLIPAAAHALVPGGALVMEIGRGQSDAVTSLIRQASGFAAAHVHPDLQGISRVVVARRSS